MGVLGRVVDVGVAGVLVGTRVVVGVAAGPSVSVGMTGVLLGALRTVGVFAGALVRVGVAVKFEVAVGVGIGVTHRLFLTMQVRPPKSKVSSPVKQPSWVMDVG